MKGARTHISNEVRFSGYGDNVQTAGMVVTAKNKFMKEICWHVIHGGGAFVAPGNGQSVVTADEEGVMLEWCCGC